MLKRDFLLIDSTLSFLNVNRNGEYGKESWRKVALQESCSMLSPVIATVAAFVNSHRFFGSPPPLRGRGFCSFLMDLGGQVTVWLPRLGHKRPYSFCLGLWAYLLLECSPSESSLRAERAQATWEAMWRVLTDTPQSPAFHSSLPRSLTWVKQAPDDLFLLPPPPVLKVCIIISAKAPDTVEQRQVISTVPCLNYWPTEFVSILKSYCFCHYGEACSTARVTRAVIFCIHLLSSVL